MNNINNYFNNLNEDLKFTPLNIAENLSLGNFNTPSWDTFNYYSQIRNSNIPFSTFPLVPANSNINNSTASQQQTSSAITPIYPYPSQIPTIIPNNNFLNNNTSMSNGTYLNNKSSMLNTSLSNNNSTQLDNEFPSQDTGDELYSYNSNDSNDVNNINSSTNNSITPMDILRNVDLSLYEGTSRKNYSNNDIDNIFNSIQENNPTIFSALKAYRIPYPIATLLVKKIIHSTLEYKIERGD